MLKSATDVTAPAREPTAGDQLRHVGVHRTARCVAKQGILPNVDRDDDRRIITELSLL